jgi:adenine phosphoribosyltransferase
MTRDQLELLIRESSVYNRCDLSRLFADARSFSAVATGLAEPFRSKEISAVAALDATGFALGGAVAHILGAGLVLLRKPGKAAWPTQALEFTDYTGQTSALHLVADTISPGQRVLLVDDWSETGAQAYAAIQLLEGAGAVVVGASFINIERRVRQDLRFDQYKLFALVDYGDDSGDSSNDQKA